MTIVGALARRSLNDPTVPISDASIAEWLTGERVLAGVSVSERRALGLTAYLRAVTLMAGTIASLPIGVYRRGTRQPVTIATVLDDPNPRQTPFEFWQTMIGNAISWGNGYGRKMRDGAGVVRQVWPLHPSRVRIIDDDPTDANPDGKWFLITDKAGVEQRYTSYDVFHLPYLALNGVQGLSPLQAARQSLGVTIAAEEHAARFYGQGAQPSLVIKAKQKLDETKARLLKARFKQGLTGPQHAHDVLVLDSDADVAPLSIPPADAQLLQSRAFGVAEIARMTGIPPHLLFEMEKVTSWGTGIEQQTQGFVTFSARFWLTAAEQRITWELLPGGKRSGAWFAEYDLDGLLRGDSLQRAQFYASSIQWGWRNRNEVRKLENLEPVDGLDEFITPSNMAIVDPRTGQLVPLGGGASSGPTDTTGDAPATTAD